MMMPLWLEVAWFAWILTGICGLGLCFFAAVYFAILFCRKLDASRIRRDDL